MRKVKTAQTKFVPQAYEVLDRVMALPSGCRKDVEELLPLAI